MVTTALKSHSTKVVVLGTLALTVAIFLLMGILPHPSSSAATTAAPAATATACTGVQPLLLLPFRTGASHKCTQASLGSCSHNGTSTKHDLDLDTPNAPAPTEDVVASAPGIAYLHMMMARSASECTSI